jgi:hypothetical protein
MLTYICVNKYNYKIYQFEKADRKQDGRSPITVINVWNTPEFQIATLFNLLDSLTTQPYLNSKNYKNFSVLEKGELLFPPNNTKYRTSPVPARTRFPRFLRNKVKYR